MRIAIGAMKHESNTFTRFTTGIEEFDPVVGEAAFEDSEWRERGATAGFVDAMESRDVELVPTSFGRSLPSGTVEASAYDQLSGGIVEGVRDAGELDAVYVDLHGSMFAEGHSDPEGDLLTRLRRMVSDDTPIVASLDMHATVTDRMVDNVDGFTAYRTAPHTDVDETGARAAELLLSITEDGRSPSMEYVRLPVLLAGEQSETDSHPMKDLIEKLEETDRTPGVLSTSYLLGFPWADSPHSGVFALAVVDEDSSASARDVSTNLATELWDRRHEFDFTTDAYPLGDALDRALANADSPTVIADSGDNPTAGATEDLTGVVERLLERDITGVLVAVIADGDAQQACADVGEGTTVSLELGRTTPHDDVPLRTEVRVEAIERTRGLDVAVVSIDGVTVIVTSGRTSVTDPSFMGEVGVDPGEFEIVVVKSGYLSPEYQDLATDQMLALTPGDTNEILSELPYEDAPRPIYPVDPETDWSPDGR